MGTEVSITTGSPSLGEQNSLLRPAVSVKPFTLRDLFVRASNSGNSMAAELRRYLNINELTFSNSSKEMSTSKDAPAALSEHESATEGSFIYFYTSTGWSSR